MNGEEEFPQEPEITEPEPEPVKAVAKKPKGKKSVEPGEFRSLMDGASYPGRQAYRLTPSHRVHRMLRAICRICEKAVGGKKYLPPGWYNDCPHDPYVSLRSIPETQPVYEDVLEDGVPTGAKRVTGTETIVRYEPQPNWVPIGDGGGVNKGGGVEKALRKGYIFPMQLRSPVWPEGIKMRCMFRECYREDLKEYATGWYCRPDEAALVNISDNSETFQLRFDKRSEQIQKDQIARQPVRL